MNHVITLYAIYMSTADGWIEVSQIPLQLGEAMSATRILAMKYPCYRFCVCEIQVN